MKNGLIVIFSGFILFIVKIGLSCAVAQKTEPYINNRDLSLISSKHLPYDLKECSGVEIDVNGSIWMINDSNNTNELFKVNTSGEIEKIIKLNNIDNNDWEDLCLDTKGTLFIGDFGNNDNNREDLAIYIVNDPHKIRDNIVTPKIIHFVLEDQQLFPPADNELFFDIEAFFVWNKQIYLFTKDRSEPFTGLTKMYVLPAVEGKHKAKHVSTYYTKNNFPEGAITSADISPNGNKVILLSNKNIWLLTDFNSRNFFSSNIKRIELSKWHQYEGIVFKNDTTLYLTNELNEDGELQLHEIVLNEL